MTRESCLIIIVTVIVHRTLSPVAAGDFKCFTKDTAISGRTCVTNRASSTLRFPSVSTCAYKCQVTEDCVSFFYADGICDGCNLVYSDLSSLTAELENSVYYKRITTSYKYVGCFSSCHSLGQCQLGTTMQNAYQKSSMTTNVCFEYCKQFGLPYFGTEMGHSCYCGDENYDMYGSSTDCNERCGGIGTLSIYQYTYDC